jgi:hypothetical protein
MYYTTKQAANRAAKAMRAHGFKVRVTACGQGWRVQDA